MSRELSLAIWNRACADATDGAGLGNPHQARRMFRELAARIAMRGGVDSRSVLAAFLAEVPRALEALRAAVQAASQPALLPLDLSYESIDRVEDYFRIALDSSTSPDGLKALRGWIACYLGTTLIERVGGTWKIADVKRQEAVVTKLPHIPRGEFDPLGPVLDFARLRAPGWLRDATEEWDVALRRATLARLVPGIASEIAGLRGDVEQLTGQRVEALDGSMPSLAAVEAALKQLLATHAPRHQRRRVQQRAVLLLGSVMAQALGGGDWTVCEEPQNADFGQFRIHGWAPYYPVRSVSSRSRDNHLYLSVTAAIEEARKP